ncbi:hypothetical protein COO60DRAFT_1180007 [Scenedesmus sp. NREL 46B-D3]|nr:hypothetical protein COO60DRAFT_1180007 [Scenedesmus sp. NREL 46B-D3]
MATMHRQVRGSTAKANTLPFRHSIIAPTCYIRQQRQRPMYASSSPFAGTTCNSDAAASVAQRVVAAAAAAALLLAPPALAFGPVSVKLDEIVVKRVDCAAGMATVGGVTFSGGSQKAACLDITAAATNPTKKPLYNADVFGRVYDRNGEAAIDDTENIRVAYIDEIAPGASKVSFKLFVPLEQYELGPLKLIGFKASGFPGKMLPGQGSGLIGKPDAQALADCEITGDCDDLEAASAIR